MLTTLLRQEKPPPGPAAPPAPRQAWTDHAARLLPFTLLAAFAALLALVLGDRLVPARPVDLATVVTVRSAESAPAAASQEGALLFQASGWIEPDPLPIKATSLVDGVVDTVAVLEGETVRQGQLLATLIDADARLDLSAARSRLASLQAQATAHHRQIEVATAEIATLEKRVVAAAARRDELADRARRVGRLPPGSIPESETSQARLQLATQEAEIEALRASGLELEAKLEILRAITGDFDARIAEAETEVARRQLALERTRVTSPVDGIVLRLLAVPGQKRMLAMDHDDSATVAILYQPDRLQVRIDVPLDEAARLAVGQSVRIRSNFLPDHIFHGSVTRIVGEADLQRNTLQAKVRLKDPDPRLRPEMLCRAEFLAPPAAATASASPGPGRVQIYTPESSLTNVLNESATVWRLDATGKRAEQAPVLLGPGLREDHRLVLDGLRPGDRVVLHPPQDLKAGQRLRSLPPTLSGSTP